MEIYFQIHPNPPLAVSKFVWQRNAKGTFRSASPLLHLQCMLNYVDFFGNVDLLQDNLAVGQIQNLVELPWRSSKGACWGLQAWTHSHVPTQSLGISEPDRSSAVNHPVFLNSIENEEGSLVALVVYSNFHAPTFWPNSSVQPPQGRLPTCHWDSSSLGHSRSWLWRRKDQVIACGTCWGRVLRTSAGSVEFVHSCLEHLRKCTRLMQEEHQNEQEELLHLKDLVM